MDLLPPAHLRYAPWMSLPISLEEAQHLELTALFLIHGVVHQDANQPPRVGSTEQELTRALGAILLLPFDWSAHQDLLTDDERGFLQALALRLAISSSTWGPPLEPPSEASPLFSTYALWKASTHWLGQLDPHTAALRWPAHLQSGCPHLQWEELTRWLPPPTMIHRPTLSPPATRTMASLTILQYTEFPEEFVPGRAPPVPTDARLQGLLLDPHKDWQGAPFLSLRELQHSTSWTLYLLRSVSVQNTVPATTAPQPLPVVLHTISHIFHCNNSLGYYQGYLNTQELSFITTVLLRLAHTDPHRIWGEHPPSLESRDPDLSLIHI